MGLAACGDDDDENNGVVAPTTQNGNTQQTLPDPEGTITARIANDGDYRYGISIGGTVRVYMDKVNNLCITGSTGVTYDESIGSVGKVKGLASITKIPTAGFSSMVATSEGEGFIIRGRYYTIEGRMYLDAYIRDAQGIIIGATLKYQTGDDWVEKDGE